jgi:hypothetical protein
MEEGKASRHTTGFVKKNDEISLVPMENGLYLEKETERLHLLQKTGAE